MVGYLLLRVCVACGHAIMYIQGCLVWCIVNKRGFTLFEVFSPGCIQFVCCPIEYPNGVCVILSHRYLLDFTDYFGL